MGGISIWQLLIVGLIIVLLFGTKKLGTLGEDLGKSIKGFKKAMAEDNAQDTTAKVESKSTQAEQQKTTEKEQA